MTHFDRTDLLIESLRKEYKTDNCVVGYLTGMIKCTSSEDVINMVKYHLNRNNDWINSEEGIPKGTSI
jgi:hypothetical protein